MHTIRLRILGIFSLVDICYTNRSGSQDDNAASPDRSVLPVDGRVLAVRLLMYGSDGHI